MSEDIVNLRPFNPANYIRSPEDFAAYREVIAEETTAQIVAFLSSARDAYGKGTGWHVLDRVITAIAAGQHKGEQS